MTWLTHGSINLRLIIDKIEEEELSYNIYDNNEEDVLSKIFLINKIGQLGNLNQVEKELDKLVLANNQIGYIAAYINNIIKDKYGEETAKLMVKLIQEKVNKEKKEDKDMLL